MEKIDKELIKAIEKIKEDFGEIEDDLDAELLRQKIIYIKSFFNAPDSETFDYLKECFVGENKALSKELFENIFREKELKEDLIKNPERIYEFSKNSSYDKYIFDDNFIIKVAEKNKDIIKYIDLDMYDEDELSKYIMSNQDNRNKFIEGSAYNYWYIENHNIEDTIKFCNEIEKQNCLDAISSIKVDKLRKLKSENVVKISEWFWVEKYENELNRELKEYFSNLFGKPYK